MSLSERLFGNTLEVARIFGPCRWNVALGTFTALSLILPQASWVKRDQGRTLIEKKNWEQAEAACKQAIFLAPEDASAYQALAECFIAQQRWTEALEHCETAISLAPESPWSHHLKSRAHVGQEDYPEAVEALEAALRIDDSICWFHYHYGEALFKIGSLEAAIPALRRSLEINPDFPWANYSLGLSLLDMDEFDEAISCFEAAQAGVTHDMEIFENATAYAKHLKKQDQQILEYCETRNQVDKTAERPLDILLVTPYPTYPPKLGAITRMFQEARSLGKQHRLVVASIIFETQSYKIVEAMEPYCELALVSLIGDHDVTSIHQPKLIRKYSSRRLTKMLKQLEAVNFDIVCFDFIYMAQYRHLFPKAYTVVGEHNIESDLLKRFAALNQNQVAMDKLAKEASAVDDFSDANGEAMKLSAYEDEHWPQFDLRTVVSTNDQTKLLSRCPHSETWVVNNGIDIEATPPLANWASRKIFFFGTLNYFPNIDGAIYFAQEVMPLIWQEEPDLQLCIAGADPPETILALATDPRIEVVESPEVMEDVAQDCHISVVPLRVGSGTRIKILHAMAMGLPVVSTSLGCEGLAGVDGEHLLIRDEPEQIAQAVLDLDRDRILWHNLRTHGRSLVEKHYDWQAIYADFEAKLFEAWQQKA